MSLDEARYTICRHCDHFLDENNFHLCDEQHHLPDDHHAGEPGETKTLRQWKNERPDLFMTHADGLIGPNSRHHIPRQGAVCDWGKFTQEEVQS